MRTNVRAVSMTVILALVVCFNAAGQNKAIGPIESITSRVDKIFERWNKPDSPGCALGVIKDGKLIYSRGYGAADLEHDTAISPKSVFYIGSTSKQFAAASIVLAAQQGKLSLDDDIRKYVPEIPDYGATITIRNLIHHTSGLRDYWTLVALAGGRTENVYDIDDIVELAARQKALNFKPGDQYLYSNTGYTLLSLIIKRAAGESLRDFADKNIFQPLGMTSTRFNDDHTYIMKNRAVGYSPRRGGGFQLDIVNNDLVGAGGLWTTVEDLLLWDQNFYSGKVGGEPFLKQVLTPGRLSNGEKLDYAYGLQVDEYRGLKRVSHGGSFAGYRAEMLRFPEHRFSVIVLCNLAAMNPSDLARQVADVYLADHLAPQPTPAQPAAPLQLNADGLVSKAGIYWSEEVDEIRRLVVKDGKLMLSVGQGIALAPLSKDKFTMANGQIEFSFESSPRGGPQQLRELSRTGKPVVYRNMPAANPTLEQLRQYAGGYFSDELQARFTVSVDGGKLVMKRKRGGGALLAPAFTDAFTSDNVGSIRFTRDSGNRISGFRLSSGRVRHLVFRRVE